MSKVAMFTVVPERISYVKMSSGLADVWLRQNVVEVVDVEDGAVYYEADSVHFRCDLTKEEIEENFDELFANGGPVVTEEEAEEAVSADALTEIQEAIVELYEMISGGV